MVNRPHIVMHNMHRDNVVSDDGGSDDDDYVVPMDGEAIELESDVLHSVENVYEMMGVNMHTM